MVRFKGITIIFTLTLIFGLTLFTGAASAAKGGVGMGYVNLQKALNESLAGRQAMQSLKDEAKGEDENLKAKQDELTSFKEEIEKKGSIWSKEVRQQKENEFRAAREKFQKSFYQSQDKLQKKKKEREAVIIKGLLEVMKKIAKEKGYDYVFEVSAGGLLVGPEEADFTNDVIGAYDSQFKIEKK
ncbi:MAG: OmpH family outer membrane protein [Thermodesulfobacteriota bacterium]